MLENTTVRQATRRDLASINILLHEWLGLRKDRQMAFTQALRNSELIVAEKEGIVVGFIHYVMHNDIIDGGPNAFTTALYVTPKHRRKGIGTALPTRAIQDALRKGAVGIETSTTDPEACKLYEKHDFKQFKNEIFLEMNMAPTRHRRP